MTARLFANPFPVSGISKYISSYSYDFSSSIIGFSILAPSSHELQSEGDCGLPEEVQNRRDENNTEDNQNLNYPSMYSKIQDSCKQQTPTVEEGDCVHAIVDPTTVEPPSQNDKLQ